MTRNSVATCTCASGLRCTDAERLDGERKRLREEYVRGGKAIMLVAWQQAEQEYQQHQAQAQAQNNLNQTQGENREQLSRRHCQL